MTVEDSKGFQSLELRLRGRYTTDAYIYIKRHSGEQDGTADRALFVCGLPWGIGEEELKFAFSRFGLVERVALHKHQTSAMILFSKSAGVESALSAAEEGITLQLELAEHDTPYGLKGWVEEHKNKFPGNNKLQKQLDDWMENFEAEEEEKKAAAAAAVDDGWTLVTRQKGRKKSTDAGGTAVGAVAAPLALSRGVAAEQKEQQLADFYKFQRKEKRLNELMELRKNFEEDKKRVAELRAARRFKPYP